MEETSRTRKLAENEVFFREANERTQQGLRNLKKLAIAEGHSDLVPDTNKPILFYCECSDENCHERIKMKPSVWSREHKNSDRFIVLPGHIEPTIEREVKTTKTYLVIEKFIETPSNPKHLNPTDVDHS